MPGSSRTRATKHAETELFLDYKATERSQVHPDTPLSPFTTRVYRNIINEFLTWHKGTPATDKTQPLYYVALVSHDDEQTVVPFMICNTVDQAKLVCQQNATDNADGELVWNEGEGVPQDHSNVDGEFWTAIVEHRDGPTAEDTTKYIYYIRPARLQ